MNQISTINTPPNANLQNNQTIKRQSFGSATEVNMLSPVRDMSNKLPQKEDGFKFQ